MKNLGNDKGLSLLEVVAVMAIFSVVSIMALQVLVAAIDARTRLVSAEGEIPQVAASLEVLRRDLEGVIPVSALVRGNGRGVAGGFDISQQGMRLTLITGGDAAAASQVDWVLRPDGTLTRRAAASGTGSGGRDVVMVENLSGWDIRVAARNGRWAPPLAGGLATSAEPPAGVAVSLTHEVLGQLTLVASR